MKRVEELVQKYIKLVPHIAKRYKGRGIDWDELIGIGNMELFRAARNYDPSKGRFNTYAGVYIERRYWDALEKRRTRSKIRFDSLDMVIGVDEEGKEKTLEDIIGTDPDEIERNTEIRLMLQRVMEILDPEERMILQLMYLEELDYQTIARQIGTNTAYVSNARQRAIKKIKRRYELEMSA